MARPLRVELAGAVYHVTARGNERKAVFRDDRDRGMFLDRLGECRERFKLSILAYCLMNNHIHLAVQRGPLPLSRAMLALYSVYAQRFNRRHRRVGHLFQGRYKAFVVQDESYLLALLRYIHLNPVRAGLVDRPESYRWSSDRHYRKGPGPTWLDAGWVLDRLSRDRHEAVEVYRRLMASREKQSYEDVPSFGYPVKGDREFVARSLVAVGEPAKLPGVWTPEGLGQAVAKIGGVAAERLRQAGKSPALSRLRLIAAHVGYREGGISIAKMARYFGREESTFCRGVQRLEALMERDSKVRAHVDRVAAALRNTGIHD